MGLKVITAPSAEPVTLAEAKLHQRVDLDADDALISMWISAIREHAEHLTERALAPATYCLYLDAFPCEGIEIPRPPLNAVSSIQYYDTGGTLATLDSAAYYLDDAQQPSWVLPAYGTVWPATLAVANAVRVTFTAGYAAADIPAPIKAYILAALGTCYANRESTAQADRVPKTIDFLDRLLDRYRVWSV
jgi:uncharacterized phiE125 gp8 family phage protein